MCFSLEAYQQTNARLYRQGQESDTVVVIHLVADKTIDEHALRVLEGKTDTQNALLDAVKAEIGGKSDEDEKQSRIGTDDAQKGTYCRYDFLLIQRF